MRAIPQSAKILAPLIGAVIALLAFEHVRTSQLTAEVKLLRVRATELPVLEAEKGRLSALQISPTELEQLRHDHEQIEKLRAALAKLGRKEIADELFRRAMSDTRSSAKSTPIEPMRTEEAFSAYAGNRTPKAVLDSVIWAAQSGNVDALAPLITFDAIGRAKALELFHQLPPDVQADYGNPEKVYATLMAANLPLGVREAAVKNKTVIESDRVKLALRLQRDRGEFRDAELTFQRTGETWQLVVPDHIVENYGTELTASNSTQTRS